ncbi:MAG: hypothetical protein WC307_06460 [Candidatus Nanoarchaeia archaeon]|jgi:hypothetical protein
MSHRKYKLDLQDEPSCLLLEHYLNEAVRGVVEQFKLPIKSDVAYDLSVEQDYEELLEKFVSHLKLVVKVSKEV